MPVEIEVLECKQIVSKKNGNTYNIVLARFEDGVAKIFSDVALGNGLQKVKLAVYPLSDLSAAVKISGLAGK